MVRTEPDATAFTRPDRVDAAFRTVVHVHLHGVPRRAGDGWTTPTGPPERAKALRRPHRTAAAGPDHRPWTVRCGQRWDGDVDAVARVTWAAVGAGGRVARRTSAWWERAVAAREGRAPQPLVHAVLEVEVDGVTTRVDMGPTWGRTGAARRVVRTGPVGSRLLGWCPLFRYEVRVVDGPGSPPGVLHVSADVAVPRDVLEHLVDVPAYTWGRDEADAGEMWTSNSVVAWLLARAGVRDLGPPAGHRAPGWSAGARA